jgi:serine/threonine-protein kinase
MTVTALEAEPGLSPSRVVGRYALFDKLAAGGMAVVHLGRLLGPVGFARTVAIKHLHPHFASSPEFVAMFLDEARLAARIRHPNVVATIDVVVDATEIFLVMDYVQGETLARLLRAALSRGSLLPPPLAVNIVLGLLAGLHAAHESTTEQGTPLGIVHRDVSPQNVMVGSDGVARVLDFGIAKAIGRAQLTREGELKGKLSYMAPEQIRGGAIDRRVDVYAVGVVLWEALTLKRLFTGATDAERMYQVLQSTVAPPSTHAPDVPAALDAVILRALSSKPEDRYATALDMALALERTVPLLSAREVGAWVQDLASDTLARQAMQLEAIESSNTPVGTTRNQRSEILVSEPATRSLLPSTPPSAESSAGRFSMPSKTLGSMRAPIGLALGSLLGVVTLLLAHQTLVDPSPAASASTAPTEATPAATTASDIAAPEPSTAPSTAPDVDGGDRPAAVTTTASSTASTSSSPPAKRATPSQPRVAPADGPPAPKPSLSHRPLYKRE